MAFKRKNSVSFEVILRWNVETLVVFKNLKIELKCIYFYFVNLLVKILINILLIYKFYFGDFLFL